MTTELSTALVIVAIGALFCLGAAWRSLQKARLIEDTPTSKIASAAQGYVELVGSAVPDQAPLTAPLTVTPCLWYRFQVERYDTSGKKSSWRVIRSGTSERSFFLKDETGLCHVHPEGADVSPHQNQVWYGNSEIPMASSNRAGSSLFIGSNRYRYSEARIHERDLLYALGFFQTIHAESVSVQTESKAVEMLAEWKKDHANLLARFDSNADGEISLAEWERARQEAATEAHSYVLENYDDQPAHILCRSPIKNQYFILASKNPLKLAKGYRWKSLAMFGVFLALIALLYKLIYS